MLMLVKALGRAGAITLALAVVSGCAYIRQPIVKMPEPAPLPVPAVGVADGSLFQGGYQPLFEDRRPRNVGDILTITLNEQVSASKSSASNSTRDGSASFTPTLVPDQLKKLSELGLDLEGANAFNGAGGSNAKNSFTGTITVTVYEVLINGNLKVRGEKQIGINQGTEYIRFAGVVNPRTITSQNSVPSTSVADAKIEYVGDGYINEAQTMGWAQRLLLNLSPF